MVRIFFFIQDVSYNKKTAILLGESLTHFNYRPPDSVVSLHNSWQEADIPKIVYIDKNLEIRLYNHWYQPNGLTLILVLPQIIFTWVWWRGV